MESPLLHPVISIITQQQKQKYSSVKSRNPKSVKSSNTVLPPLNRLRTVNQKNSFWSQNELRGEGFTPVVNNPKLSNLGLPPKPPRKKKTLVQAKSFKIQQNKKMFRDLRLMNKPKMKSSSSIFVNSVQRLINKSRQERWRSMGKERECTEIGSLRKKTSSKSLKFSESLKPDFSRNINLRPIQSESTEFTFRESSSSTNGNKAGYIDLRNISKKKDQDFETKNYNRNSQTKCPQNVSPLRRKIIFSKFG